MIERLSEYGFDIEKLSVWDKIKLVRESDGLLIELLKGETIDNLYLVSCVLLKELPENIKVDGDLFLRGCTSLTCLPENLEVGGCLDLDGCIFLTHLPENLRVNNYLDLGGCTSLACLPKSIKVDGNIYLPEHLK